MGGVEIAVISYRLDGPAAGLTDAETNIVELLFEGFSNAEIAEARGTSTRTVANQLAALYRKLGVTSRSELVARLALAG